MGRVSTLSAFAALAIGVSAISTPTCGSGANCPESAPCCSAYGQCGVGAYCLGGCDPINSYDLSSCVPAPTCQSANYKLDSLDDIEQNTLYLGNASSGVNWVSSGTPAVYTDGSGQSSILLTMPPDSVGTLLTSTHYVWYGKIAATMQTSAGQGVVTAFVMMSDVKDEIDFEFVGDNLQQVQSNYYWQGVPVYTNSKNLTAANTNTETHVYEVDWTPESLTWSVDGTPMRTLSKSQTFNSTDNKYHYPQTPARIQLSLWPAGKRGNALGTVNWAGGYIDWNSPYMSNGYYYAQVSDVTVECYNPPAGTTQSGSKSYVYDNISGLQSAVEITNDEVVLASFYASGDNPNYNPDGQSSGSSNSVSSAAAAATNVQTVPGVSQPAGSGIRGDTSGGSSAEGDGGSTVPTIGGGTTNGGFSQGTDNTNSATRENAMQGSAFAVLVAFLGCMML